MNFRKCENDTNNDQENNIEGVSALPGPSRNDMTSNAATLQLLPTINYSAYYNMSHSKRGIALIFVIEDSVVTRYFNYYGLTKNLDYIKLRNTLRQLEFDVRSYNCNDEDIIKILEAVANEDHSENDCLMTVMLYYGTCEYLCSRNTYYNSCKVEPFYNHFTADKCPTLAGKPKLFFIQICQLGKHNEMFYPLELISSGFSNTFRIEVDFLFVYTFVIDCPSWITTRHTYFIEGLCYQLSVNRNRCDLLTLLTFVCEYVTKFIKFSTVLKPCVIVKEKIPYIISMLTRLVQFTPKILE
ncbi:caspase-like [Nylanderia fulva]|uniref:caspase-like n=1 Tax=Nylanderia fulva TaxID=613905 RepID=UPI0010FB45EF|nr:caspase-like [Nylanderia fulva]XP_029177507.1 caspase-like [Nylanderia fulva]